MFHPYVDLVPVSGAKLTKEDISSIVAVAKSGWITEGKYSDEFRDKLTKYTGIRHAILCNSGSSANLLAMTALIEKYKVPEKSLIVTSALAFQTTVAPILQTGMVPFFLDADWSSLNPNVHRILRLAEVKEIRGLILAHTLGFPIRDMQKIAEKFHANGKFVIEDCCDALGAMVDCVNHVGTFGDAATLSFFPAHQITTGEGGAVLTNDGRLFASIRAYSNWGRDCWCKPGEENSCNNRFGWKFKNLPEHYDHKYVITKIGYNLKMTDLQAALGSSQMDRINSIVLSRQSNYYYLRNGVIGIPNFTECFYVPAESNPQFTFSPFGFPIMCLQSRVKRSTIIQFLYEHKIMTRPIFTGNITKQPMMEHVNYLTDGTLDGCNDIMENYFWIGCHPELSLEQLDFVLQSFDDYLVRIWKK